MMSIPIYFVITRDEYFFIAIRSLLSDKKVIRLTSIITEGIVFPDKVFFILDGYFNHVLNERVLCSLQAITPNAVYIFSEVKVPDFHYGLNTYYLSRKKTDIWLFFNIIYQMHSGYVPAKTLTLKQFTALSYYTHCEIHHKNGLPRGFSMKTLYLHKAAALKKMALPLLSNLYTTSLGAYFSWPSWGDDSTVESIDKIQRNDGQHQ